MVGDAVSVGDKFGEGDAEGDRLGEAVWEGDTLGEGDSEGDRLEEGVSEGDMNGVVYSIVGVDDVCIADISVLIMDRVGVGVGASVVTSEELDDDGTEYKYTHSKHYDIRLLISQ